VRFLIFLFLFLNNGIVALAGDLGSADFQRKQDQELGERAVFFTNCGGGAVPKFEKCTLQFVGNKLIVDVSKGIVPSQVRHFYFSTVKGSDMIFSIIYEDDDGKLRQAGIGTISNKEANAMMKAFMKWFNSK
tara:strand:+ start:289 stop:684 length:396 start_codon:yes stop_codon:yes gene_type:complete